MHDRLLLVITRSCCAEACNSLWFLGSEKGGRFWQVGEWGEEKGGVID